MQLNADFLTLLLTETIVGVNKYKMDQQDSIDVLTIDNKEVLHSQIQKLSQVKGSRDSKKVDECLQKITSIAESGDGNLLEAAVDAARARCTVGEISSAMEKVFGRHVATGSLVSGAYKSEYEDKEKLDAVTKRVMSLSYCMFF